MIYIYVVVLLHLRMNLPVCIYTLYILSQCGLITDVILFIFLLLYSAAWGTEALVCCGTWCTLIMNYNELYSLAGGFCLNSILNLSRSVYSIRIKVINQLHATPRSACQAVGTLYIYIGLGIRYRQASHLSMQTCSHLTLQVFLHN